MICAEIAIIYGDSFEIALIDEGCSEIVISDGGETELVLSELPIVVSAANLCQRAIVQFGHDVPVPESGELFLDGVGGVNTDVAPVPIPVDSFLEEVAIELDDDGTGYTFEILENGIVTYSLPLVGTSTVAAGITQKIDEPKIQARITGPAAQSPFARTQVVATFRCATVGAFGGGGGGGGGAVAPRVLTPASPYTIPTIELMNPQGFWLKAGALETLVVDTEGGEDIDVDGATERTMPILGSAFIVPNATPDGYIWLGDFLDVVSLPPVNNQVFTALFFENLEGFSDGEEMNFVTTRVGPNLSGGPLPPTWSAAEQAAFFDATKFNYFRAIGSAASGVFDLLTAAGTRYTLHVIEKYTGTTGTFETIMSTATLTSETGARHYRTTGGAWRVDTYPDSITENSGNVYTNLDTQYLVRSIAVHSDPVLDPSFARYRYIENGVVVDSDASAFFAGTAPQTFDAFFGVMQNLLLPADKYVKGIILQSEYDDDGSRNGAIGTWFQGLP